MTRRQGTYTRRKVKVTQQQPIECSRDEAIAKVREYLDKFKPGRVIQTTLLAAALHIDPKLLSRLKDELWQYVSDSGEKRTSFGNVSPVYIWHAPIKDRPRPEGSTPTTALGAEIIAKVSAFLCADPEATYSTADMLTAALGRKLTQADFAALKAAEHGLRQYWRYGPERPGAGRQTGNLVRPKIWSGSPQNEIEQTKTNIAMFETMAAKERAKLAELQNPTNIMS